MMNYEFISTLATIIIASVALVGLILRMDGRITRMEQRMDGRISELGERVARIEGLLEGYFASSRGNDTPPPQG